MNLKALRDMVKNVTDYSPTLQQYNDQLDSLLNEAYFSIWSLKRWTFSQREEFLTFYPDIMPGRENAPGGVTALVVKGDRRVIFSGGIDRLTPKWEGQPIEIQEREYIISKVEDTRTIYLTEPFAGTGDVLSKAWTIKFRTYTLPEDCIELLYLGHREYPYNTRASDKLEAIMPRREETLNLDADKKADKAEAYIWQPPMVIPSGEKLVTEHQPGPTTFPFGSYLELCWCFEKDGEFGPLSEPLTHQFDNDNMGSVKITFKSWDDQDIVSQGYALTDDMPPQYEGLRKFVFWNANYNRTTGERLGIPKWKHVTKAGLLGAPDYFHPVEADDDEAFVILNAGLAQIDPGNDEYKEVDGQHLRIRPYPRVDGWDEKIIRFSQPGQPFIPEDFFIKAIMRYVYKPMGLSMQTDTPEMPYEFHRLIVYKTLEDMYLKLGSASMADTYRKRIEREIKSLQKRYCDHIDSNIVRGQFGLGYSDTPYTKLTKVN